MSADRAHGSSIEGDRIQAVPDDRSATRLFAVGAAVAIGAVAVWRLMSPDAAVSVEQKPGYAAAAMAATGKGVAAQVDAGVASDALTRADVGAANAADGTGSGEAPAASAGPGLPGS